MTNSYNPTKWVEYKTVATANVMNNIEKGIVDAHERVDELDSQIKENENKISILNSKTEYVTVEMFGAKGDGVTDDTLAFQNAIDYCSRAEGSIKIQLSPKTYIIGNIDLKRYTFIQGAGWKSTFLKIKQELSSSLITITENNANLITLKDFCVLGDKENNTCESAILINKKTQIGEADENWKAADSWTVIENIRIVNMYGDGIKSVNGSRECRFTNLNINNCNGWGMNLQGGSDNNYQFITCWCNFGGGIKINESADRFVSCKCFANGNEDTLANGFYIGNTIGITLISCEAQENYGHGFYLYNTKESSLVGFRADCNGLVDKGSDTLRFSGVFCEGDTQSLIINGVCDDFRRINGSGASQKVGISLGNTMFSIIDVIARNNEKTFECSDFVIGQGGSNKITINGEVISRQRTNYLEVTQDITTKCNTVSLGKLNDEVSYQMLKNSGNYFQVDVYKNGQWQSAPFTISSNSGVKIASSGNSLGFFGSWGKTKQTSVSNATDLNSAIALVNNLKEILKGYGLID